MTAPDMKVKPIIKVPCAIIEREGKVLAAQRSASGSLPLKWEFPGGKLEEGESDEEALVREIREELCVEIQVGDRLPATERDDVYRIIMLIPFVCQLATEDIILTEHAEIRWLSPEELPNLDWAEADRGVIADYINYLTYQRSEATE